MVKRDRGQEHGQGIADPHPALQGRIRARSLEAGRTGRFALLKTYPICRWSGELGPKIKEGDRQAPEGFYKITPGADESELAISTCRSTSAIPNAFDRAHGRTGAQLMVHGDCSSRGCYAMTDEQICGNLRARRASPSSAASKSFQVQAYPFRMTPAEYRQASQQPEHGVLEDAQEGQRPFRGDAAGAEGRRLREALRVRRRSRRNGRAADVQRGRPVPGYEVPEDIASAVREKQHHDEVQIAELTRRGTAVAPVQAPAPMAACIRCSWPSREEQSDRRSRRRRRPVRQHAARHHPGDRAAAAAA